MKDELQGWYRVTAITGQCSWCKYTVTEGSMAACEYAKAPFPHATKCHHYEPKDMDE